jgi:hypothetical protein
MSVDGGDDIMVSCGVDGLVICWKVNLEWLFSLGLKPSCRQLLMFTSYEGNNCKFMFVQQGVSVFLQ